MSTVNLIIGGRDYAVACAPGEEAHVSYLGGVIDDKLEAMPQVASQSEARALLFAALMLADEVSELRDAPAVLAPAPDRSVDIRLATRLHAMAQTLENLAEALENLG
jgi:cell division protein ZapA